MQAYRLTDGIERNRARPDTFHVPSDETKARLQPGDFVKLGFDAMPPPEQSLRGERMWVIITERNGDSFVGELNNVPFVLTDLQLGERVEFEARHILDIDHPEPQATA